MRKMKALMKRIRSLPSVKRNFVNYMQLLFAEIGLLNDLRLVRLGNGMQIRSPDQFTIKTIWSIFVEREYGDMPVRGTIIDIGAHVGVFSTYCCAEAEGTNVLAFEPFGDSFEILKENISESRLQGRVNPVQKAVCGEAGKRTLYFGKSSTSNSLFPNPKKTREVVIDCTTIKDIMDEYNLDECQLLKVDCEGCEFELFANVPPEYFDRINAIKMEFHSYVEGSDLEGLVAFLVARGYRETHRDVHMGGLQGVIWLEKRGAA